MRSVNKIIDTRLLSSLVIVYTITCLVLYVSRLTSILHAESSAIVTTIGFFGLGMFVPAAVYRRSSHRQILASAFLALFVPLLLLTLSNLWVRNCAYVQGLQIFGLFALPSTLFAVGLALIVCRYMRAHRRLVIFIVGLLIAVVPTLIVLKVRPQFYIYNHVFGGVLGPVYEEELFIRPGMIWARLLTAFWGAILISLSAPSYGRWFRIAAGGAVVVLYAASASLGIVGSTESIGRSLGSTVETDHFILHYDSSVLRDKDSTALEAYHEYHYSRIASGLQSEPREKIRVFIYPDAETKARLTGAGTTSVAPVWLNNPQVHILESELGRSLDHELVHVFSRDFGGVLTNASTKIGLVEGLAVALEAPDGLPNVHDQVHVLFSDSAFASTYTNDRLQQILASPRFWLHRGAVAYSLAGSFIRWLLAEYPASSFREVYSSASFDSAYGKPVAELISEWKAWVVARPVDREAMAFGSARFSIPSLFERECPHYVPRYVKDLRAGVRFHRELDFSGAEAAYTSSLAMKNDFDPARTWMARLFLHTDRVEDARAVLASADSQQSMQQAITEADIALSQGDFGKADSLYAFLSSHLPRYREVSRFVLEQKRILAETRADAGTVFNLQDPLADTTIGFAGLVVRGFEAVAYDADAATYALEIAVEQSDDLESGPVNAGLTTLYYWSGEFNSARRAAGIARDYFAAVGNDELTDYYEYILALSEHAASYSPNPDV